MPNWDWETKPPVEPLEKDRKEEYHSRQQLDKGTQTGTYDNPDRHADRYKSFEAENYNKGKGGLIDLGVKDFMNDYEKLDDETFRDYAAKAGLAPEKASIIRDMRRLPSGDKKALDNLKDRIDNSFEGTERDLMYGEAEHASMARNDKQRHHRAESYYRWARVKEKQEGIKLQEIFLDEAQKKIDARQAFQTLRKLLQK